MNKLLILITALLSLSLQTFSQVTPTWAWGADYSGDVISTTYHDNHIYVIGNYYDTSIQMGSVILPNAGGLDTYIAKWDTIGNLIWVKSISDTGSQKAVAIHVNSNNEIVIGGNNTNPSLVIGNDTITTGLNNGAFITMYDTSGNVLDAFGVATNYLTDFCIDNSNNIYASSYTGVFKYSGSGIFIWQLGVSNVSQIVFSSLGSCIMVIGSFVGNMTLGGTTIAAAYSSTWGVNPDIYCFQADLNGNVNWLINVTQTTHSDWGAHSYLQESTGDLFIPSMFYGLAGEYADIHKISLNGVGNFLAYDICYPGVILPPSFPLFDPEIKNISGKDSILTFMLHCPQFSGINKVLGIFNLNTQKTILSYQCSSDYHLYEGPNSIYMKGYIGPIAHTFGKLGPGLLTSPNTHFTNHYCFVSTVNLTSNVFGGVAPLSYSWAPSIGLSSTTNSTTSFVASTNTSYTLTVTDANSQVVKDTFDIIVDTPLNALVITPQNSGFCHDSLYLFSNLGLNVNWYKYDGLNWNVNFPMFYNDSTIIYDLGLYRASISNECNTVADTLQIDPIAIVNANASSLYICIGQPLTLFGSGALTYTWSGGVLNNIAFNPIMTQTYTVTGIDINGCMNSDTISVDVNPTSSSTTNISICSSALPFVWNSQSLTSSGIYTSTFINALGCDSVATLNLTLNFTSTSTTNTTICSTSLPYVWNTQTLTSSGIYTSTFTNVFGCDSIATLNLIVNPLPLGAITPYTDSTICIGTSYVLHIDSLYASYTWTWNGNIVSSNDSVVVDSSGSYIISCTDTNGCIASDTVSINILPAPQPTIIQNNYTLTCTNTSNVFYQWYLNGTTIGSNDSLLTITQDGQYIVKIIDSAGCIGFDTLTVIGLGIKGISSSENISIYPNPTSGEINLEYNLNESTPLELKLFDAQGRVVWMIKYEEITSGKYNESINLKSLELKSGVYLLTGRTLSNHWTKRIVYLDK